MLGVSKFKNECDTINHPYIQLSNAPTLPSTVLRVEGVEKNDIVLFEWNSDRRGAGK